jgi:threonyl-tRNA synthetase
MPVIRLPDGSQKSFPQPVTVAEVAQSIGAGLARAALAGRVNGKLVDMDHRIDADAELAIVTDKDPAANDLLRHSTAHLLANAVQELFPGAQVTSRTSAPSRPTISRPSRRRWRKSPAATCR